MSKTCLSERAGGCKFAWIRALCLMGAMLAALTLFAGVAFADSSDAEKADSLNGFGFPLGNDYVWTGEPLDAKGFPVKNDLLAAGRTIKISDAKVGGSIRAAAQNISIDNVETVENVTIAGESIAVNGGSANAVLMTGRIAEFTGKSSELHMYANKVVVDGVVDGDAVVAGDAVEIGPNAVVKGTLSVSASAEPVVPSTAKIGKIDVKIGKEGASSAVGSGAAVSAAELSSTFNGISDELKGLSNTLHIVGIIITIISTLIIAVLAEWLFRRHTAAAAEMIRVRTGATIGSGIIGALVAPIVIIILCCLVVTLPVAGALALALFAMTVVADGFMGASVFKLAFPKLGRYKTALIGGAIMGVASAIPYLGTLTSALAFMYFLGYVLQTIFLSLRASKAEKVAKLNVPVEAATPAAPVSVGVAAPEAPVEAATPAAPVEIATPEAPVEIAKPDGPVEAV